jgi:hypothetical protein
MHVMGISRQLDRLVIYLPSLHLLPYLASKRTAFLLFFLKVLTINPKHTKY